MDDWKLKAKAVVKLVMKRDVFVSLSCHNLCGYTNSEYNSAY